MLRTVALGSGLIALVPTVSAAAPINNDSSAPSKPPPMRASELPIYESPHADYSEHIEEQNKTKKVGYIRSALKKPVSAVREQVQTVWSQTESVKHSILDNYREFQDRTDWIVKYLREEENKDVRYGAVVMGGLTGFVFGLRGGIIRRLFYAGVGTTAMGAICFPEQTKDLAKNNGQLAKQYINIAYNFLYGVKPGDPQLEVKFPELSFPKDFSEFVDLTVSVASSVKQVVMPPPTKEADTKPEKKD